MVFRAKVLLQQLILKGLLWLMGLTRKRLPMMAWHLWGLPLSKVLEELQ